MLRGGEEASRGEGRQQEKLTITSAIVCGAILMAGGAVDQLPISAATINGSELAEPEYAIVLLSLFVMIGQVS